MTEWLNKKLEDNKSTSLWDKVAIRIKWDNTCKEFRTCLAQSKFLKMLAMSHQFSSVAQSCPTLYDPMDCSTPGFPVHHQLLELAQIQVHRVRDAIQLSHPQSSPSPLAFNLSQHQGLFQWVSSSHQVEKDWSFSFSISPSNEYSGLTSFKIDWFDLLAVQGSLKSLLHHHSSKASVLRHSAFFMVQLSHPYMTTEENHSFDQMDLCWQSNVSAF